MPEHDYREQAGPPAHHLELDSFGFGCGAVSEDGICSAVVLRMVTDIGPTTVVTRAEMSADMARELSAKLQDMAAKVDAKEQIPQA
jgi:hypothetical protein